MFVNHDSLPNICKRHIVNSGKHRGSELKKISFWNFLKAHTFLSDKIFINKENKMPLLPEKDIFNDLFGNFQFTLEEEYSGLIRKLEKFQKLLVYSEFHS